MSTISIYQAGINDLEWINSKYQEVDFVKSDLSNEHIIIASVGDRRAGLGRLVQIDEHNVELGGIYVFADMRGLGVADRIVGDLCDNNPYPSATIWCLPFAKLETFYKKFGFTDTEEHTAVPQKVADKHEWCNVPGRYADPVLLLQRAGKTPD